jgi:hypothetical protein
MISRRQLLFFLGLLGLTEATYARAQNEGSSNTTNESLPPHCEALTLVWNTQADLIKTTETQRAKLEVAKQKESIGAEGRWWFDTDERGWKVTRPFAPGQIDSTHIFLVTYTISGSKVISWTVDTRKKEVSTATK